METKKDFSDAEKCSVSPKCDGCATQRLQCWIDFTNNFQARVQQLFDVLDVDGDAKLSKDEFLFFTKKTGDDDLNTSIEKDCDFESLLKFYHQNEDKLPHHERLFGTYDDTNSFFARVKRLFGVLDIDADGKISQKNILLFSKKIAEMPNDDLVDAIARDIDIESLCKFYHDYEVKLPRHERALGTYLIHSRTNKLCAHCALAAKTQGVLPRWYQRSSVAART